jgi:mannitol/fructose-specific phosphotransferase system IIA component (Ntr-type)
MANLMSNCVQIGSSAKNKDEVIRDIARLAKQNPVLGRFSEEEIYKALKLREDLDSTGFTNSVAIPHCALENIPEFVTGALIIPGGVDFGSHDGQKTKILFFIVGPKSQRNTHIHLLSSFSRIIKNEEILAQLINAKTKDAVV